LQEQQQRRAGAGARWRVQVGPGSVGTLTGIGAKARTQSCGRCVTQEAGDSVEEIRPVKKPRNTWSLSVWIHSPPILTLWLPEIIEKLSLDIGAPDQFVNVRLQEERIAEAKRKLVGIEAATGACIGWDIRRYGRTRPQFSRVREVGLIQFGRLKQSRRG
jgi:hypothetical protein